MTFNQKIEGLCEILDRHQKEISDYLSKAGLEAWVSPGTVHRSLASVDFGKSNIHILSNHDDFLKNFDVIQSDLGPYIKNSCEIENASLFDLVFKEAF